MPEFVTRAARHAALPFRPLILLAVIVLLGACDRGPVAPAAEPAAATAAGGDAGGSASGPEVVISQVYGAGGNSGALLTHDYVELFNRSAAAVDVSGWRIHYASAAGTTWNNTATLQAGSVIQPGGYFLVRMSGGTTGAALPAPDDVGTINMAAGAGKLVLTRAQVTLSGACPSPATEASVVDYVAYGTTTNCDTWGNTPNISTILAAFRNGGGCTWTGSNTSDFTTATPAPRNSSSPANPCETQDDVVATVTVSPATAAVGVGGTQAFTATAFNAGGQPVAATFSWSSDDAAIATVDAASGVATGIAPGSTTITATAPNGVTGTAALLVSPPPSFDVVISQVYGGGGNSGATLTHDYVELFNRGASSVDVSGWRVQYASSAGTNWLVTELPAGPAALIPPGGYYLVQLATNNEAIGAPLPAADATGTTNMAAGAGKVVLTLANAALSGACPAGADIIDRVNYGGANCATEWGNVAALSATLAALRNGNGCDHTGNVTTDFTRAAPAPRTSASLRNVCQGPSSVTVAPATADLQIGATFTFTANGFAADGQPTAASYSWSSDNTAVATVDAASGVVTAVSEGSTTITATAQNGVAGSATLNVTAPPPATGLIITEFLSDPDGADTLGEWFEIYNAGPGAVDLLGWHLRSGSSTGVEAHTIASSVVVPAGGFVVLGNNADVDTNGGVNIAYSYGGDIILNNSNTDWLTLKRPDGTLEDSVAYSARTEAGVIVSPTYTPAVATSRVLVNVDLDNTVAATSNWQNSTLPFGDGRNRGSPGWGAYGTAGPIASVMLFPSSAAVLVGGTTSFTAVALDALGRVSGASLTWSSSNTAIASVNAAGVITGHDEGVVTITATASTGAAGSATLAVVHPNSPATITVGLADPSWLPVGYEKRAFATVRNWTGDIIAPEVTWSVSDPARAEIVTYDGRTYVRTLGAGTIQVIATAANGVTGSRSFTILPEDAPTPAVYRNHIEFGMPTPGGGANDIIITKQGFVSSYNPSRGGPNWVSWNINATHFGPVPRCDCFSPDPAIPEPPARVNDSDFINGGYDRGHMVQSESRTTTEQENAATFLMSNILPQAADNNQGSWLNFENHLNNLARQQGREIYVIAGGLYADVPPTIRDEGKIHIPDFTWKIAVVMEAGQGLADVTAPSSIQVLAVNMPNLVSTAQRNTPWQAFTTTVDALEAATGYDFLAELPEWIQRIVESGTRPPVAVSGGPYTGVEGSPVQFDGSASHDPDAGDVLSFAWSFGDGNTATGAMATHTYADNGVFQVRLIVSDQHGAADTTYTTATIANAAPVITALTTSPAAAIGADATVSVTWTDAGTADTHVVEFDWGDGTSSSVPGANGTATAAHAYAAAGFYVVRVTVRDDDGGEATRAADLPVAVFDPNGSVTGGGTFDAPAGALVASPTASGRANLTFTARSTQGGFSGNLEMHLNSAGFRFTAEAFDWLVTEGPRATLRGTGRLRNDAALYSFALVVQDASSGSAAARLVIRNAAGDVVFDNVPGAAAGTLAPVTGSITVRN